MTTATRGSATSATPARRSRRPGRYPLMDDAVRFVTERLLEDGPQLKPAYTIDRRRRARPAPTRPARLSRRHGHRRQLGQQAVPARRVRRGAAAASPPPRGHDHLDTDGWRAAETAVEAIEQALARARHRRGDLGDRTRRVDAQPADLRRRAAPDRAARPARRAGRAMGGARRRDRLGHRRARASSLRALAALAQRPAPGRGAAAGRDPRRDPRLRPPLDRDPAGGRRRS